MNLTIQKKKLKIFLRVFIKNNAELHSKGPEQAKKSNKIKLYPLPVLSAQISPNDAESDLWLIRCLI